MKTLIILVSVMFLSLPATLFAQWSSDPMLNTPIDISSAEQTLPKIEVDQSGNVFIAYFSNASGNYDVMLHYLNHDGYPIWPEPLVVSNNTQDTWISDFSAMIDYDGNCVITFTDIRNGTPDVYAYKVSADGQQIWGENGIRLSDHPEGEFSPVLCITTDNNAIVSWIEMDAETGDHLAMAGIDNDGNLLWDNGKIVWIPDDEYSYASPYLFATNDGEFIIIFSRSSGPFWSPNRLLYAQRLSISGVPVWLAEAPVNNVGGLTAWGELSIKGDGQGGFYVAWYDDRDLDMVSDSYVQHVDASGNLLFTANGVNVGTKPGFQKFYPLVAGQNDNNEVFVYWVQTDFDQNNAGLYGQRLAADGTKLWPEDGLEIISPGKEFYVLDGCDVQDTFSYLFFELYGFDISDNRIKAKCLDADGNSVWEIDNLSVSEVRKEVIHSYVSDYSEGQWIMAWSDTRVPDRDLYAQNINEDGSIGNPTGIIEPGRQDVAIYPNPCTEMLNIRQNGYQQLCVTNMAGQIILIKKINEGDNPIRISDFNPGLYIFKLTGTKGIVVERVGVVGH